MHTIYVYQTSTGAIVETNHNSLALAQRSAEHRAAQGGIVLNITESPTHANGIYHHPCSRFCTESCVGFFCARGERGEA